MSAEQPFSEIDSHRLLYANSHRIVTVVGQAALGVKVFGQEHIPQKEGALIAANHRHWLDILTLPSAVPNRHVAMVAKHELFDYPVIGPLFEAWGALPIHRDEPTLEEMQTIIRRVREGHLAAILPEGTRDKTRTKDRHLANLSEFRSGAAMIARRAGAITIPAALYGMDRWLTRRHAVAFGEPMEQPTRAYDVWIAELETRIENLYAKIDERLS